MISNPKVSIIIPVYNREKIIKETLDSALLQEFSDYEVVVCDNCSTDKTWDVLVSYSKKYENFKIYKNDNNVGPVRNWAACLEKAKGTYLKILWSDDLISKDFLSKTVPILDNDEKIGFVYTLTNIFSNSSNNISYKYGYTGRYLSKDFIHNHLFDYNQKMPVSPGNALFRTSDVVKNLIIEIENPKQLDFSKHGAGNDLLIFLLTANEYKYFYFINEQLSLFRSHDSSISVSKGNELIEYYVYSKMYFLKYYNKVITRKSMDKFFTYIYIGFNKRYRYMLSGIKYRFRIPIMYYINKIFQRILYVKRRILNILIRK